MTDDGLLDQEGGHFDDIAQCVHEMQQYLPHPVLDTPNAAALKRLATTAGPAAVVDLLRSWVKAARDMVEDPLRCGYVPDNWRHADKLYAECKKRLFIGGGNRAGKTRYCAWKMMQLFLSTPKGRFLCMHESNASSIAVQQAAIYEMIPPELKNVKKSRVVSMDFSLKNGFTDNILIFPNGAQVMFRNYTQDVRVVQGDEFDAAWLDECFTLPWYDEVGYRLATRRGKCLLSVTPIFGYTSALAEVLDGLTVEEYRPSELLKDIVNVPGGPKGEMPYIGSAPGGTRAIWFHSDMNIFSPWDELCLTLEGRSTEDVQVRAYGWVDKISTGSFPKFGNIHVVAPENIPKEGTNYKVLDPAGQRNWFALWGRVDPDGVLWILREWPDFATYGEWAMPDKLKLDGKRGSAQTTGAGRSVGAYRKLFRNREEAWGLGDIFKRIIDPRAGKSAALALRDNAVSLIQLLRTPLLNAAGNVEDAGMHYQAASGVQIDEGLIAINSLLDFNTAEPLSFFNQPRLRISSECKNLIWCMTNWKNADPADQSASKDPVDALRYLALDAPRYIDPAKPKARRGGSY